MNSQRWQLQMKIIAIGLNLLAVYVGDNVSPARIVKIVAVLGNRVAYYSGDKQIFVNRIQIFAS